MKIKLLYIFASILTCLSSCTSIKHEHIIDENWSYNELMHWKRVTCTWNMCKFDLATEEHIDEDYDGICDICTYPDMGAICP